MSRQSDRRIKAPPGLAGRWVGRGSGGAAPPAMYSGTSARAIALEQPSARRLPNLGRPQAELVGRMSDDTTSSRRDTSDEEQMQMPRLVAQMSSSLKMWGNRTRAAEPTSSREPSSSLEPNSSGRRSTPIARWSDFRSSLSGFRRAHAAKPRGSSKTLVVERL